MTLDELLAIPSNQWDTLSDQDLDRILRPYFAVTRPDPSKIASIKAGMGTKTKVTKSVSADLLSLARQLGLNLPSLPSK